MNYATHYERLIARAKSRVLSGYVERHHIVPTCIGGTDDLSNLVALTPEEHYVAHQLLIKMHPGNAKLIWAAARMTGKPGKSLRQNKLYGWLRRKMAQAARDREYTPEMRARMSAAQRKRPPPTEQAKANMGAARLGKKRGKYKPESKIRAPLSDETRRKLSEAHAGVKRGKYVKHKFESALKGIPKSVEHRAALSAAKLGVKRGPHSAQHRAHQSVAIKAALAMRKESLRLIVL